MLCEDHQAVREGLRLLLEAAEDIEVVGEVTDGLSAVREARRLRPDVLLLDLSLPLLGGVEATRQIVSETPSTKVLILSAYMDEEHVVQAVEAGASGYLTKGTDTQHLLQAVHDIAGGRTCFSLPAARWFVKPPRASSSSPGPGIPRSSTLTGREKEVLKWIAEGLANMEIADAMGVSVKTVEKHRQAVMNKLGLHATAVLTAYAVSMGVVGPAPGQPRCREFSAGLPGPGGKSPGTLVGDESKKTLRNL